MLEKKKFTVQIEILLEINNRPVFKEREGKQENVNMKLIKIPNTIQFHNTTWQCKHKKLILIYIIFKST